MLGKPPLHATKEQKEAKVLFHKKNFSSFQDSGKKNYSITGTA
jgi:hypothetical protein